MALFLNGTSGVFGQSSIKNRNRKKGKEIKIGNTELR
jgi:hypothetical protein